MNEIWKDVVGYEGIYEVSNLGRIRTHENKKTYRKNYVMKWKQRIMKLRYKKGKKYWRIILWKDGKEKSWLVHRVVAFAFIPTVEGKELVNHIDGDGLNNFTDNLEWCNDYENINHAFDNRLIKTGKETILINKKTKEEHSFRSMVKASEFLGRCKGEVQRYSQKGKTEIDGYTIKIIK